MFLKDQLGQNGHTNKMIPQERNPEIILAGFTDWSKADVKSLGQVFVLSTVLTGFADTKLEHCLLYSLLNQQKERQTNLLVGLMFLKDQLGQNGHTNKMLGLRTF
jgi:hypothetical protein